MKDILNEDLMETKNVLEKQDFLEWLVAEMKDMLAEDQLINRCGKPGHFHQQLYTGRAMG